MTIDQLRSLVFDLKAALLASLPGGNASEPEETLQSRYRRSLRLQQQLQQ